MFFDVVRSSDSPHDGFQEAGAGETVGTMETSAADFTNCEQPWYAASAEGVDSHPTAHVMA